MFTKLSQEQINSKKDFIRHFIGSKNAADGSTVDANANVTTKNIANLHGEIHKDINIQLNRAMNYDKIKELFGEHLAKEYLRQINSHEIYVHDESNINLPYCVALSLHPFITNGLKQLGGESKAPKHISSFCGGFVNLLLAVSGQFAGACATTEFFIYMDYFARKDYGENYLETHKAEITQHLQHVVYVINQPAVARNSQSVFWNVSILDKYFMKGLFEHFRYPDNSELNYESVDKLQFFFLNWFNKERERTVLTFPVVSVSMLSDTKTNTPKDYEFANKIAEEMERKNSFFIYHSNSVDSLSSCCFTGDQKTLTKSSNGVNYMSFEELERSKYNDTKRNFTIFHNGSWCKGNIVKIQYGGKITEVVTVNNKVIKVTEDHIHATLDGDKKTSELTENDYLLFSKLELNTFPEKDLNLKEYHGMLIGAYLGDGSCYVNEALSEDAETKYAVNLSINEDKYKKLIVALRMVCKSIHGSYDCLKLHKSYNNVYPVVIYSKKIYDFIKYWVGGNYAVSKQLNLECLLQSSDFRKGIYKGYYITDGGNSNRIYTTSEALCMQMEVLFTSLGMPTIIDVSDRTDEPVIIRGQHFNRNHKLYCIRWYASNNKRSMQDVYVVRNNNVYFKIKSLKEVKYDEMFVYCFQMADQSEPYFTLPNGIITHNCRLRNAIQSNEFSYTLGNIGIMTGSIHVITLNMNRLIQKYHRKWMYEERVGKHSEMTDFIANNIREEIQTIHKYHVAFRQILKDYQSAGLLPVYDAGFITLDKQYSTIGINGLVEGCEYLGFEISNNPDYIRFVSSLLKVISDENKKAKESYKCMFNTEFVPAENLGVKNAKWDKEDDYKVTRDCYNSYFYIVENESVNVIDKFILHGDQITKYLDGGSALHLNLQEHLTKEQYLHLMNIAIKTGCSYWTINVLATCCEECEHIDKDTLLKCSKCGSSNITYATRIIGYLKKISSFSTPRQIETSKRYRHGAITNDIRR